MDLCLSAPDISRVCLVAGALLGAAEIRHPQLPVNPDVHDVAVVEEPVDESRGHDVVAHTSPHSSKPLLLVSTVLARSAAT